MAKPKSDLADWNRIETDYRAGILPLREIAEKYNNVVSHAAIQRRAKKEGWSKDLSAKIKVRAADLVTRLAVTKSVTSEKSVTDKEAVDANANMIAEKTLGRRINLNRHSQLAEAMLAELEAMSENKELFAELGEFLRGEGADDKRNELYRKILALPSRVDTHKKLVETLKVLHDLENKAFGGLDARPEDDAGAELCTMSRSALEAIAKRG